MNHNTKLIIGISLPLLVILFVIGSVVFPKLFFNPKYDFIYTLDSYCKNSNYNNCYRGDYNSWLPYKVVDGKIAKETTSPTASIYNSAKGTYDKTIIDIVYPKLYRYNVKNNSFQEISLEEVQKISITDGGSSPDGTVVVNDSRSGGLIGEVLGGGGSRYGLYMKNGSTGKKIIVQNGVNNDYYYSSNFRLIGWVK